MMAQVEAQLDKRSIERENGHCWTVIVPEIVSGDSNSTVVSTLVLYEDGRPLGPSRSLHDDIRKIGCGRFSHWGDVLYFSTSDNSDPRTSGRTYIAKGPRREGSVPHARVLRGYEVVPSFFGQPLLNQALIEDMENHAESAGKSSWGTRNVLHAFVLSLRPETILEIGAHIGSASVVMGAALKANRFGRLYCLEPQEHYFKLLSEFVAAAGLTDFVFPLQMFSTEPALRKILPAQVEMIYVDANHSYSHALRDLEFSDSLLADNGLILLDDVGPTVSPQLDTEHRGGVRQAVLDFSRQRNDLKIVFLEPPFWLNPCGLGIICKQKIVDRSERQMRGGLFRRSGGSNEDSQA